MKTMIATAIALALSATVSYAQDEPKKPDCTPQNSPIEVIFGSCHLVKGVPLYGQGLENLSGIADGMSPSGGGSGGIGSMN